MTTGTIELEYRLLPCGCCFIVSTKGLPLCHTADPIPDAAQFLKEAGAPDETTISMRLEGSDQIGISYLLGDAIEALESDVPEIVETQEGPSGSIH